MSTYFSFICTLLFYCRGLVLDSLGFSFIFTLQEFAGELISLTDAMGRIYAVEQARVDTPSWFRRYIVHGPSLLMSAVRLRRRNLTREKSKRPGLRRLCQWLHFLAACDLLIFTTSDVFHITS